MDKKRPSPQASPGANWRRLALALLLAFAWTFIPLSLRLALPLPPALQSGGGWAVPLAVGPAAVRAGGGLTITKIANPAFPTPVDPGGSIVYTLIISNNTGTNFDGLSDFMYVSDDVPTYTTCTGQQGPPAWDFSATCNPSAVWLLSGIFTNSTQVALTYTVEVSPVVPFGTVISNTAYQVDANNGAVSDTGTAVITTPLNAPRWSIDKTISSPAGPFVASGADLEYTITFSNSGSFGVSGSYVITDTVPPHTTLLTATLSHTDYTGTGPGSVITWTLNTPLSPGGQSSIQYSVRVTSPLTKGTVITNDNYGIAGGNVFAPASGDPVGITVESTPVLELSKSLLNPRVGPGSRVTYIIAYSNTGNATAHNVRLTDTLPASLTFVSSAPASPTFSDTVNGVYSWLIPALPPASPQTINLAADVDPAVVDGTPITNTVTITSPTEGALAVTDTLTTVVRFRPNLLVGIRAVSRTFFLPADPVTYTVVYTNDGTQAADTVAVTVTISKLNLQSVTVVTAGAALVSSGGGQFVFAHRGVLSPSETGAVTITGQLVESPWAAAGESFGGQVKVAATPQEIDSTDNTASVTRQGRPDVPVSAVTPPIGDAPINKDTTISVIEIRDAYGNPVFNGTAVGFSISPIGVITPSLPSTAQTQNGQAQATITSGQPGAATVTVDVAG
ncbi:MAG: hypothetical protein ACE5G8_12415, partial [Anaerolineae bacterium]